MFDLLGIIIIFSILENVFGIEKLIIDEIRIYEICANNENFCRCETRSLGLVGFNLSEEFIANPNKGIVILGSENLGNESTTLSQEIDCKLKSRQGKFNLIEGILLPVSTDIGSTIIEYNICLTILQFSFQQLIGCRGSNILNESFDTRNGLDGDEIQTNLSTSNRTELSSNLQPTTWSSTKINDGISFF